MTPKITNEMRDALTRSHGRPVDVEDEQARAVYVLVDKNTFAHLQEAQGTADEATRQHLRLLIEQGIASGDYQPADAVFDDLRKYAEGLASQRPA